MPNISDLVRDGLLDARLLAAASGENDDLSVKHVYGFNTDLDTGVQEDLVDAGGNYAFPTQARVHAIVSGDAADVDGVAATGAITIVDWEQMLAAAAQGSITIIDYTKATAASATFRIRVVNFEDIALKTVTVDGNALVEGTDFDAVTSNAATATDLASAIDGISGLSASASGDLVTITVDAAGAAGNSKAVSSDAQDAGIFLSGATFENGRDALTITIGATALVAGTDFTAETSNTVTATNLAAAIDGETGISASSDGAVVTVVDDDEDESGNATVLTGNNTFAASVSATAGKLGGGEDLLTLTINTVDFVAGVDFTPSTSNEVTAAALAAAIEASEDVAIEDLITPSASGAVVTLTADVEGTTANSYGIATDDTDSATVSGANMAGGRAAGTGAHTVRITGLDTNYAEITEDVALNGATPVNTTNSYLRVNEMKVIDAGSGGVNAGAITATAATDSTVSATIAIGNNIAYNAVYTVPAGYTAYIMRLDGGALATIAAAVDIVLRERPYGEMFIKRSSRGDNGGRNGVYATPRKLAEKTDIIISGVASADNTDAFAEADLVLVKNA